MMISIFNKRQQFLALSSSFLIGCFSISSYAGVEEPIEITQLPKGILEYIADRFPDALVKSANTETEDNGEITYEIQVEFAENQQGEIDFNDNIEIDEIEMEFSKDMVPGAVLKALETKIPGFVASYIEATHSASMDVIAYEFQGELNGAMIDLEVSADGREIKLSDN